MRPLIFNAFSMASVSHVYHGMWTHPRSEQIRHDSLSTWTHLARLLERGRFDGLFLADALGLDPTYRGSFDLYVEQAIHFPCNDPAILCAALIGATEHLGLMFTSSILQAHPFAFARAVSTLDHLSGGRVGWNIVTSTSAAAARNFGLDRLVEHDARYDWADEYVDVAYKLWEHSWRDDAIQADTQARVYADPAGVRRIDHVGARYRVPGPHASSPSPQRTPLLIQAGSSRRGRAFAARHAEATFIVSHHPDAARVAIDDLRAQTVAHGRRADDLLIFQGLSFVVGSTEEEAQRRARELDAYVSTEGLAAHVARDLGIDFGLLDPERPVSDFPNEGLQGFARFFEEAHPGQRARLADLVNAMSYSSRFVGTPEQIADRLAEWRAAGVDGVNLAYQTTPGSFEVFIDHVMPVLRARGLAQHEYAPGTLREKLFPGRSARLNARHPAVRSQAALAA
ncbi:NtaA/DmoA family FMN-dependent monooxygenase [Pararobbsia silviterrae]|uniref:LLM class flavin-dependent oxidoreductase n=1 Tax=Pararobbsia silviterrae TaxID=1792498 RepID=A0A494Y2N9_9BURK|nr:NtaA/DmoA family FMN-dependent monooxygenase [Pararobbsia silviterrae]RKP56559.1 LLM class flavin-dependent oxidoreductase [Pararobbsia silviterrae]